MSTRKIEVAFGLSVRVGDTVCYPVITRGTACMKRIQITEITNEGIKGYNPDDPQHRMLPRPITRLHLVVPLAKN